MLVLTRRAGEKLVIGHDIVVSVLEVRGSHVKIGIQAPDSVRIVRAEIKTSRPDSIPAGQESELDSCDPAHDDRLALLAR